MPHPSTIELNDGNQLPSVGLGLWRIDDNAAEKTVCGGVEAGYRLLDTAAFYGNETGVGRGIRSCGLDRKDLFITTKIWNDRHGFDESIAAFNESIDRLKLDYLDLLLIHWPVAGSEKYLDTWRAFIHLKEQGRVRSIGVSNFLSHHLNRLVETSHIAPAVNQIEYHPYFRQEDVLETNRRIGAVTQAWAPIGRAKPFAEPVVTELAEKYSKTPAQIVLRWHIEQGRSAIPKSSQPQRMKENIDIFDFTLTPDEVAKISSFTTVHRIGDDPNVFSGITPAFP